MIARREMLIFWLLLMEELTQLLEIVCHSDAFQIVTSYETLCLQLMQRLYEGLPESFHIVKDNQLPVITNGTCRSHREDFIECADTSRQSYQHIALRCQQVFALTEVLAINFLIGMENYLERKYPMSGFGEIASDYARNVLRLINKDIDETVTIFE